MIRSQKQETAYLIGVITSFQRKETAFESLDELNALANTSGVLIAGSQMVEVRQISAATFIGKGKIEEIGQKLKLLGCDLVIFDVNLAPSQNKALEEAWDIHVIDRTSLILDIFALHAKSREGKLQVELAQYQYLYPRLVGAWTHLSKQRGGGVGLRGPGETQLEVDRRRVRERITHIKNDLKKVERSREIHRKKRASLPIPTITLIGYTNAGKSTLFNKLTEANVLAEDKLFATLDPKTKRISLPSGRKILLTDTVGFIRNLPHQLVEAFKSTFEEVRQSALLIHVVDGSRPHYKDQIKVVNQVLEELKLNHLPMITVLNKMDQSPVGVGFPNPERNNSLPLSALTGAGIPQLLQTIDTTLQHDLKTSEIFLPHPYGAKLSQLYTHGHVHKVENTSKGAYVTVALPEKWLKKLG